MSEETFLRNEEKEKRCLSNTSTGMTLVTLLWCVYSLASWTDGMVSFKQSRCPFHESAAVD